MKNFLFTSESVTEGHPDKLCDQVADSVLDAIIAQDPTARVACEVMAARGLLLVTGEITTDCCADIERIARDTVRRIGYTNHITGFDANSSAVMVAINSQSSDIAMGVDRLGAGDQGMMFGYATDETDDFMPLPIHLAHKLAKCLADVRKARTMPYLGPDGKSQVTVEYRDGKPFRVDTVVISAQHSPDVGLDQLLRDMHYHVITATIPRSLLDNDTKIFINPTGRFVVGGPQGDTGLTGRKIIVDTYGGFARHGGGAFSGKDPTKVDRSAAYAARHIAKNIVAAGLANKLEIQISYAIGIADPVSITVDTFGTGNVGDDVILELIRKHFDLRPSAIIERLGLRKPIYSQTAAYGHFGRNDLDLPWERLDMVGELKKTL